MIIDQLPEIGSVQSTDEMPVERGQTTYKTPISKICTAIFASPTLTGTPKAPTAGVSTDNTQIATTAFANRAANNAANNAVSTIGIVQNTNTATQNISEGQYVIWHGALYTASAAIASGAALSSSNLTAVSNGGLNDLRASLTKSRTPGSGLNILPSTFNDPFIAPNDGYIVAQIWSSSDNDLSVWMYPNIIQVSLNDKMNKFVVFAAKGTKWYTDGSGSNRMATFYALG